MVKGFPLLQVTSPYCGYCPDHGLVALKEQTFNQILEGEKIKCLKGPLTGTEVTSPCQQILEAEKDLFKAATIDGCQFCKRTIDLIQSLGGSELKFIYDEKKGKIYCHPRCLMCANRKCTIYECAARARYAMYLYLESEEENGTDGIEYLIPAVFCLTHGEKLPNRPDDNIWNYVSEMMTTNGVPIPKREKCFLKLKEF